MLNIANGNYIINHKNITLEQTEQIEQMKINKLFKLNLKSFAKKLKERKRINSICTNNVFVFVNEK